MIWEIDICRLDGDWWGQQVEAEFELLSPGSSGHAIIGRASCGYLIDGSVDRDAAQRLSDELLQDPVVESARVNELGQFNGSSHVTVLRKPGVMDPAALSVIEAAEVLGIRLAAVRTFRRYQLLRPLSTAEKDTLFRKVLANPAVEQVIDGPVSLDHLTVGAPYEFERQTVAVRDLSDDGLDSLSKSRQLALSTEEMRCIQTHFSALNRDPSDIELETIAQTWSEHCSHKTLKGRVECSNGRIYDNLLKETIFAATQRIREELGADDWCVSVFEDNAGIVKFDDTFDVCFKVETHNRPSAIEPYGGANTGVGGVIRDVLGCGLGAKPIANTDVFCFAPPVWPVERLPPGIMHPVLIMRGVVAGVRDYGNRTGIPTVNGAVYFDDRYIANPLVFCGTIGLLPANKSKKEICAGDRIVVVGGRTGRDGIHGATFSSAGLDAHSETVSGGAVQIGNAITEKKLIDVLLQARGRGLYRSITDCGAGGFSSAIGELAAELGAIVHLDRAPLKYSGLTYSEIWISESQERMILAVPPERWPGLEMLCNDEGVEAAVLGTFEATGRLQLFFRQRQVGELDLQFLHHGRCKSVRQAIVSHDHDANDVGKKSSRVDKSTESWARDALFAILAAPNIRSKEPIIRQYDHEVQGGTVIKPLVGINEDGPGDAAVITPVLGSNRGLAIACGLCPKLGDFDAFDMAANAIDEAVRNLISVGADPARIALLDNFCWGNTNDPVELGALVRSCEACRDLSIAWRMPFISGKDSLHNEYRSGNRHISIPRTLLISAIGIVPDVSLCVTVDLKRTGNHLYLVGETRADFAGSQLSETLNLPGGSVPRVQPQLAFRLFRAMHIASLAGLLDSCHDLSDGGLAVAVAEMAFSGGIGADLYLDRMVDVADEAALFAESPSRWLVEVRPEKSAAFEAVMTELPVVRIGTTVPQNRLRIGGASGSWLVWATLSELKSAWQTPLGL